MPVKKKVVRRATVKPRAKTRQSATAASGFQRTAEVERWILKEVRQQERVYRKIVREMNALNDRRIKWVKEFYARLQTRGFCVHAGLRRKVRPEEIPRIPRRIRVVF